MTYSINMYYCTVHIRCNLRGKLVLNAYAILANAYAISANAYAFLANAFERVRYINARACILNPCDINAYTRVNAYAYACGFNYERV